MVTVKFLGSASLTGASVSHLEMGIWPKEWALDTTYPKAVVGILAIRTSHFQAHPLLL